MAKITTTKYVIEVSWPGRDRYSVYDSRVYLDEAKRLLLALRSDPYRNDLKYRLVIVEESREVIG